MAVTQRLRYEILKRDNSTCRYCGATAAEVKITVDHVVPVALGGTDDPTNLVAACQPCNAGKSSVPPNAELVAQVAEDAVRFASALESVTAARRQAVRDIEEQVDRFDVVWGVWTTTDRDGGENSIPRDDDWEKSIETFLLRGLNIDDLQHFVHRAMTTKVARYPWRLFCRYAWDEINERQELARAQFAAGTSSDTGSRETDYARGFDEGWNARAQLDRPSISDEVAAAYERGFRAAADRDRVDTSDWDPDGHREGT